MKPETAPGWPDMLEPPRLSGGSIQATLVSYQPTRTFRRTFEGLSVEDAVGFARLLDLKPRVGKRARVKPEWVMRDRSVLEGGLTYLRLTAGDGAPLPAEATDAVDAGLGTGPMPGSAAVPSAKDHNEALLGFAERGKLSEMIENPQPVDPDTWLLHFSADAGVIAKEGFCRGTHRMSDVGFSHGGGSRRPGYNYAFPADDEFSVRTASEYATFGGDKDRAVLFRSAGVACRFIRDDFNQVIFWGPDASRPFVLLTADHSAEENAGSEPHDWAWTAHLPDGTVTVCENLFDAIRLGQQSVDPPRPGPGR